MSKLYFYRVEFNLLSATVSFSHNKKEAQKYIKKNPSSRMENMEWMYCKTYTKLFGKGKFPTANEIIEVDVKEKK